MRSSDTGVELDVPAQIKAISNMLKVTQYLGLRRITFRPDPVLLQLIIERIAIFEAEHIAARAGIAVPIPGAANAIACLKNASRQPELAQFVEHIKPRKAGTDDHGIIVWFDRHRVKLRHQRQLLPTCIKCQMP